MQLGEVDIEYVDEDKLGGVSGVDDLVLLSLNVRSLVNKLSLFEIFLDSMSHSGVKIDIILLTETFLSEGNSEFYNLPGYKSYHMTRPARGGGGMVFYVRDNIEVGHAIKRFHVREVEFMIIKLEKLNVHVCGVYRPPTSTNSNKREFLDFYDQLLEQNSRMISLGDFNIDLLDDTKSRDLRNILTANSFNIFNRVHPDSATRSDASSFSIIDHVHSDITDKCFKITVGESALSDHKYLLLVMKKSQTNIPSCNGNKTYINFKNVSTALRAKVENNEIKSFDELHSTLTSLIKKETSSKTIKANKSTFHKPWFDQRLRTVWRLKKNFIKLKKKFPTNDFYALKFIEYSNLLKKECFFAKKRFYSKLYKKNTGDSREFWKITKEIISNNNSSKSTNQISLKLGELILNEPVQVANEINNFFTKVGADNSSDGQLPHSFEFYDRPNISSSLKSFEHTTAQEIKEKIQSLKKNTASGLDSVSTQFLKNNSDYLSPFLSVCINNTIDSGIFPDSLKFAKVTPIFKSGDPKEVGNYRPISVLPSLSKIFEMVIRDRLVEHLHVNKIIHKHQYGFLKGCNTTSAASCLVNDIVASANKKLKTAALFIDISKAFDCLDFKIMKKKLTNAGVTSKALDLLCNYFENRKQIVIVNGASSEIASMICGSPQGSIISPILFLIYINDLLYLKLNGVGRLYADDAGFCYQAKDYKSLHNQIKQDLITIDSFLLSINFQMSISKTKFMIFCGNKRTNNDTNDKIFSQVCFNDKIIESVDSFSYLGLTLDSALSWRQHIEKIIKKIAPFIGVLRRIRYFVNKPMLMQLYYAFVHSRLIYCLPIWSAASQELLMKLQRLQNKAIKYIRFLNVLTPTSVLYDEKFLSFQNVTKYESTLFIHKIAVGLVKSDFNFQTCMEASGRVTRQANLLRVPQFRTMKAQKSVYYRGTQLYNDFRNYLIDTGVKNQSLGEIKRSIKAFAHSGL